MNAVLIFLILAVVQELKCANLERINDKESDCFAQEKIYHEPTDKCYKLVTKGPCPKGQWFILEKPKPSQTQLDIKAVCVQQKCPDGQYYWSETNKCVEMKDQSRFCGDSKEEELLYNIFGEGECLCKREPPRARLNGDKKNPCFPLYTRGPCPAGKILGTRNGDEAELEKATCIEDPCHDEAKERKKAGTLAKNSVLAAWSDGKCYELGTQGPCAEKETFKVHSKLGRPVCVSLLNQIIYALKPCVEDANGVCSVSLPQAGKSSTAEKYKKELFSSINNALRKKRNIRKE